MTVVSLQGPLLAGSTLTFAVFVNATVPIDFLPAVNRVFVRFKDVAGFTRGSTSVHMCHGFAAGTYQTIQAMTGGDKLPRVVCPRDPPPSRNEAIRAFVTWARRNSRHQGSRPLISSGASW